LIGEIMSDSIKIKFEEIDKYLSSIDKYIDDIKWSIGGIAAFLLTGSSIFTIAINWNYNQEKITLRELKKELKEELKISKIYSHEIKLTGLNGSPLTGQKIPIKIGNKIDKRDNIEKSFTDIKFIINNQSNTETGSLFIKLYTKAPFISSPSTDEPNFESETYIHPTDLDTPNIPGQYTTNYFLTVYFNFDITKTAGEHEMLLKFYNKNGPIGVAKFTGIIEK